MAETHSESVQVVPTMPELFQEASEAGDPERPFTYFEGSIWSYREMDLLRRQVLIEIQEVGLGVGDRIMTMMTQEPQAIAVLLGISSSGAAFVPVIPESSLEELAYFIENSGVRCIVVDEECLLRCKDVIAESRVSDLIVVQTRRSRLGRDEAVGYVGYVPDNMNVRVLDLADAKGVATPSHRAGVDSESEFAILYTSGSTSRPKGAIFSHKSFAAAGRMLTAGLGYDSRSVLLGVMPLYHAGGLFQCLAPALASHGSVMLQRRFSVTRFWDDVEFSGANAGLLMSTIINILLAQPPRDDDADNSLQMVYCQSIYPEAERRFGFTMNAGWGMTETAGTVTGRRPWDSGVPIESAGFPLSDAVKIQIRGEEGQCVPPGTVGEIWCNHDWIFTGYVGEDIDASDTLVNGWVRSGDLGRMDRSGRLYFIGRKKHMIKRAGENVSPREVEDVVNEHPEVVESACFGVSDPIRGEEVMIVVVPRSTQLTPAGIATWCQDRLAPFKVPRYVAFRSDLPKTPSEKPDYLRLANEQPVDRSWDRVAPDSN